jgi:hypothetical protein
MVQSLTRTALLGLWFSFATLSLASVESAQQGPAKTKTGGGNDATVVVTGCLDDGGYGGHYFLTNARTGERPESASTASQTVRGVGTTYNLVEGGVPLQAHVGHRVEVTGVMDPVGKAPKKGKQTAAPTKSDKDVATARAMNATLTVKSVRMVSTSCP